MAYCSKKRWKDSAILVIVAHPDDEVLGCGGAIARWAQEGARVYVCILGEGLTSRYDKHEATDRHMIENLRFCSKDVAKLLGAEPPLLYDFPDNRFDTAPLLDLVKIIEKLVDQLKPSLICTHFSGDLNVDHQIVSRAVVTACRPMPCNQVQTILFFEVLSSTEWQTPTAHNAYVPNWYVDVSDTLDLKKEALGIYASEIRLWPHPRSKEAIESLAKYRGSSVGFEAAEAFILCRHID